MRTQTLGVSLVSAAILSLALGCEGGDLTSARPELGSAMLSAHGRGHGPAAQVRWDIAAIQSGVVIAGGIGTARASTGGMAPVTNGPEIRLTGTGTFVAPASGTGSSAVTGGGTWETFDGGSSTGSGTYAVTRLARWIQAPASLPPFLGDGIADRTASTAGLAVLSVRYSDGSDGVLIVSCSFGVPAVFEGVTASKGFVDYWSPPRGSETTLTIFHILRGADDGDD